MHPKHQRHQPRLLCSVMTVNLVDNQSAKHTDLIDKVIKKRKKTTIWLDSAAGSANLITEKWKKHTLVDCRPLSLSLSVWSLGQTVTRNGAQ